MTEIKMVIGIGKVRRLVENLHDIFNHKKVGDKVDTLNQNVPDLKREYLIRTLSRTKRKDYENYVINAIYHKLDSLDIQPVTQQYIRRSDGKYGLVDLYFPQLNYGVECDEAYHLGNVESDNTRILTMENMLDLVEETQGFILRRVHAYENIDVIHQQIKDIVGEIKQLLSEREIKTWDIDTDPSEYAIKENKISVTDRLQFDTIANLCKCFGKNYKNMQRSYFNIGYGYYIWCPKLAIITDGTAKSVANGWINTLSDDWDTITEQNDRIDMIKPTAEYETIKRITFAKSKDVLGRNTYRFIGIFEYVNDQSTESKNLYKRTATEISLTQWLF